MKKFFLSFLLISVLSLQMNGGTALASASVLDASVPVNSVSPLVSSLTQVVQLLKQVLYIFEQKVALGIPATFMISQSNVAATIMASTTFSSTSLIESITTDGVITGWAIDVSASNTQTLVNILVDGQVVGTTSTYIYRSDINAAKNVTGKHGFTFALSTTTKSDGKSHAVDVKVVSNGLFLTKANSIPTTQVFTPPPTLSWSTPVWGKGIPDIEVWHGGDDFEIFGNRQATVLSNVSPYLPIRKVTAIHSLDGGATWSDIGTIATATKDTDLGDGSMTFRIAPNGQGVLYFAYRYNQATTTSSKPSYFSIRLKQSTDFGKTWTDFGTPSGIVHQHFAPSSERNGLWTPQVLFNSVGDLLVNYDDQLFPDSVLNSSNGGQFGMMKKWDRLTKTWSPAIIIGQGTDGRNDGVGARTQISLGNGRIWSPVESSVGTTIHSLALRFTESYDHGKTWSMTPGALAAKQIVSKDWNQGNKDESILYELPPRGVNTSGAPDWYNWSWPLAVKLQRNPDENNIGKASAVFVLFRSDEERPYTVSEGEINTSRGIEKKLFYLLSTNGTKSWVKGKATDVPIIDHRPVALHDGSVLIGYSLKDATDSAQLYQIKKGCFSLPCSL